MSKAACTRYRVAPNIALIKYWGKFDEELILPLNSNVSVTLDVEDIYTETAIEADPALEEDMIILNGSPMALNKRIKKIFAFFRSKSSEEKFKSFIKVVTFNNFPTASGLASSSSGLACLTLCLADFFGFAEEHTGQLTEIARLGSGSASRSIFGGLVMWHGVDKEYLWSKEKADQTALQKLSKKCIAVPINDYGFFEEYEILILMSNMGEKDVGSTDGMKTSVETSELLKQRVNLSVDKSIANLLDAIKNKDHNLFAEIVMRDSNQFHAVCLDTYPPLFYLNKFSRDIIKLITSLNEKLPKKLGYTFDAGPHAVVFVHKNVLPEVFAIFYNLLVREEIKLNKNALEFLRALGSVKDACGGWDIERMKNENLEPAEFMIKTKCGRGDWLDSRVYGGERCGNKPYSPLEHADEIGNPQTSIIFVNVWAKGKSGVFGNFPNSIRENLEK